MPPPAPSPASMGQSPRSWYPLQPARTIPRSPAIVAVNTLIASSFCLRTGRASLDFILASVVTAAPQVVSDVQLGTAAARRERAAHPARTEDRQSQSAGRFPWLSS